MKKKILDPNRWLFGAAILAHVPIAIEYSMRMWNEGHYQFFPLLIAAVAFLFYSDRHRIIHATKPGEPVISSIMFGFVYCAALTGTVLMSSFIGAVSMWSFALTTIYWMCGRAGAWRSAPLLFLLLIVVPLPGDLDGHIIARMQVLASNLASWTLDAFGFVHFREGVVLVTVKERFFTEEACSGIRSLYSSLAGIAIYSVVNRYRWWRIGVNLVQTVAWVLFGNALRIATVVWVADNWTRSIADGTSHEMLGVVVFVLIMFLAISTDRLLSTLFPQSIVDDAEDSRHENAVESNREYIDVWGRLPQSRWAMIGFVLFFIMALGCCRLTFNGIYGNRDFAFLTSGRLPFLSETDMPENLGTWKRVRFEHIHRGTDRLFAEDSFTWAYSNGIHQVLISVDCPWHEFHDLELCYGAIGWKTQSEMVQTQQTSNTISEFAFKQTSLKRLSGETGIVLYSALDRELNEVVPDVANNIGKRISIGLTRLFGASAGNYEVVGIALPVTMVQLYCEPGAELSSAQVSELRAVFVEARTHLATTRRFSANGFGEGL